MAELRQWTNEDWRAEFALPRYTMSPNFAFPDDFPGLQELKSDPNIEEFSLEKDTRLIYDPDVAKVRFFVFVSSKHARQSLFVH